MHCRPARSSNRRPGSKGDGGVSIRAPELTLAARAHLHLHFTRNSQTRFQISAANLD